MTRLLAVLAFLLLAAPAGATSTLTKVSTAAGPAYSLVDAPTGDTTTLVVDLPVAAPREARRYQQGQTYTFTTSDAFDTTVPAGCNVAANLKTITCKDTASVDADVASAKLDGGDGNDAVSVRYTGDGTLAVTLWGGRGDDTLIGGSKAEVIEGQNGVDTLSCNDAFHNRAAATGVTVDLHTDPQTGSQGGCDPGDVVKTMENAIGSTKDDTLTGTEFENRLDGLAGNDKLFAGGGTDVLVGGAGGDELHGADLPSRSVVSFDDGRTASVALDLSKAPAIGGDPGDTYVGTFAGLQGTPADDTLTGGPAPDLISGLAGNDVIRGGPGGDTLDGGAGTADQLHFDGEGRTAGVTVDLGDPAGDDGDLAEVDAGFEQVFGTDFDDNLTATPGPDLVLPGGGADTVFTLAGADTITADDGELDTIDCGDDADTVKRDPDDAVADCESVDPPVVEATPEPTEEPIAEPTEEPTEEPTDEPFEPERPRLRKAFAVKGAGTRVKTLSVVLPDGGGKVAIACRAPKRHATACAFSSRTVRRFGAAVVALAPLFKHRRLPPGTRITLRVTGPSVTTTSFGLRTRRGKQPAPL